MTKAVKVPNKLKDLIVYVPILVIAAGLILKTPLGNLVLWQGIPLSPYWLLITLVGFGLLVLAIVYRIKHN